MAFNEQRNKNKAKVWTVVVHILLMLWFAFYGLTYQDPPPEEGIAINFGYEETGAGQNTQAAPTIPPDAPVMSTVCCNKRPWQTLSANGMALMVQ